MAAPRVSIVINTYNRAGALARALESLQWLTYDGGFEVIVVNGPSTDGTGDVIRSWEPAIRAATCDVANLSASRNIGICMARGEIVAFIDDDAIPEPEWLTELAAAYRDPGVGGAGGFVLNHTGYEYQYRFCVVDRLANDDLSLPGPTPHLCFPGTGRVPHLLGCNSSFRRSALLEIGGFDEEFEYYLDETDVCLRLVDAGYLIVQVPGAHVHHQYAPSDIRQADGAPTHRYPVVKNRVYFALKHARAFHPLEHILQEQLRFIAHQRREVERYIATGSLPPEAARRFDADVERALETGLRRGFEGARPEARITAGRLEQWRGEFTPFTPRTSAATRRVVLVSRGYPPDGVGGIATFTRDLAEALAGGGHIVHVIAESTTISHVDFDGGVWVHRIVTPPGGALPPEAVRRQVPPATWRWSAAAVAECHRIASHHRIDVVEAPVWDCEGIAFVLDGTWPLVTSLQTTLHYWLETHPEQAADETWMRTFGRPMLALEREVMTRADAVRSISAAIRDGIEQAYGFTFDPDRVLVAPLGVRAPHTVAAARTPGLEILFVGRLEARKGIDVLLATLPRLLEAHADARVTIAGDNELAAPGGRTYMEQFLEAHAGAGWLSRVRFLGRVPEEVIQELYASCDIFVAPSRFESFGLVYLEAMRVGKPVIGCRAGGVPEIVTHEENGLLVPPGDPAALGEALDRLLTGAEERARLGEAGRRTVAASFTAADMAQRSLRLYEIAMRRRPPAA